MEDYIFLIIAVALSIFGALNQNKKRKAEENTPVGAKAHKSYAQPFLDFELMETEDEEEAYEKDLKQAPEKVDFKSSMETKNERTYHVAKFKSTLPDRPRKAILRPSIKLKEDEATIQATEETSYLEDFSLRKAIVYSEILKPKY